MSYGFIEYMIDNVYTLRSMEILFFSLICRWHLLASSYLKDYVISIVRIYLIKVNIHKWLRVRINGAIPCASAKGNLMYVQVCIRPNIVYAMVILERYQSN